MGNGHLNFLEVFPYIMAIVTFPITLNKHLTPAPFKASRCPTFFLFYDMVKFPSFVNRFVLPLVLFLLFFYFFGLSSLKKGSEKDVVVVGKQ